MKRKILMCCAISVLLASLPAGNCPVWAGENSNQKAVFIDLDGDGFNDSVADRNKGDKLENSVLEDKKAVSQSDKSKSVLISFNSDVDSDAGRYLSKSEKFGLIKFSVRAMEQCRGESDARFGGNPGNGIGSGKMNNACIGGICFE